MHTCWRNSTEPSRVTRCSSTCGEWKTKGLQQTEDYLITDLSFVQLHSSQPPVHETRQGKVTGRQRHTPTHAG